MKRHQETGWKIALSVTIALIAVGHIFRPKVFDEFVALLLLAALSPWLIPFFSRYLSSVEAFGGKVEFLNLKKKVQTNTKRLDDLYVLSMSDKMFKYLEKLSQPGGFGPFYVSPAMPRELGLLEDLGYIDFKGDLKGMDDFKAEFEGKPDGGNLSDYIELTDTGKKFYKARVNANAHTALTEQE